MGTHKEESTCDWRKLCHIGHPEPPPSPPSIHRRTERASRISAVLLLATAGLGALYSTVLSCQTPAVPGVAQKGAGVETGKGKGLDPPTLWRSSTTPVHCALLHLLLASNPHLVKAV